MKLHPRTPRPFCRCLAAAILLLSPGVLLAAEAVAEEEQATEEWKARISPYGWLTGLAGKVTAAGTVTDISISFSDLLEITNSGAQVSTTSRHGKWALALDATVANLGPDIEEGPVSLGVDIDQVILEVLGGYQVFYEPAVADAFLPDRGRIVVNLLAGARYWSLQQSLTLTFDPLPGILPPTEILSESDDQWVDPLLGVIVSAAAGRRVRATAGATIGGFGVGSASDFTWSAYATFSFLTSKRWSFSLGYRFLGWDRTTGSGDDEVRTDLTMAGPLIGASYTF